MRRPRNKLWILVAVALSAVLAAVVMLAIRRPADLVNWLTPGFGTRLESDIAYGDLPRQRLDVYRPSEPRGTPAPVVVFFYGGGWSGGTRDDYRFVGRYLARQGFVTVIPDYRVRPEVVFPGFLEDGAKALRWIQDHIAEQGGDPRRIVLVGHSAGAYNAMMLALDRRYGEAAGFDATRLRGVVGLAGPYDFKFEQDYLQKVFGGAPDPRQTQPVTFAVAGAPPVMLVTGDADETVRPQNSRSLARHLEAVKSPVRLRELPGTGHISVVLLLSWFGYPDRAVRDEIIRFLDRPDAP